MVPSGPRLIRREGYARIRRPGCLLATGSGWSAVAPSSGRRPRWCGGAAHRFEWPGRCRTGDGRRRCGRAPRSRRGRWRPSRG